MNNHHTISHNFIGDIWDSNMTSWVAQVHLTTAPHSLVTNFHRWFVVGTSGHIHFHHWFRFKPEVKTFTPAGAKSAVKVMTWEMFSLIEKFITSSVMCSFLPPQTKQLLNNLPLILFFS